MKKFYTSVLAGVLLLATLSSQGQTYNSISSNPGNLTFDDPNFWVGGIPPPNPCNACSIFINANVAMVQQGSSTASGINIFTTQTPAGAPINNPATPGGPITLGTVFQPTANGYITGVRFYKGVGMGSSHTGYLWQLNPSVNLLGTVTFSSESASGWQSASFGSPVSVLSGNTYIVAYYVPDGIFELDNNYFTSQVTNGPLTALQDAFLGPNGRYNDGAPAALPLTGGSGGYVAINSWVDVNFSAVTSLNDMVFNGSTITVNGTTTLNINTYVELTGNSKFIVASGPSDVVTVNLNDQMDLGPSSLVQIGNAASSINSNNLNNNPIVGPHDNFNNPGFPVAGIYSILVTPYGGEIYSFTLGPEIIGLNPAGPIPPTVQQQNYGANDGSVLFRSIVEAQDIVMGDGLADLLLLTKVEPGQLGLIIMV